MTGKRLTIPMADGTHAEGEVMPILDSQDQSGVLRLGDGTTIVVRNVITRVVRLDQPDADGNARYALDQQVSLTTTAGLPARARGWWARVRGWLGCGLAVCCLLGGLMQPGLAADVSSVTSVRGTGTAGTPATGVVTVQGASSMTPVVVTGGTQDNQSLSGPVGVTISGYEQASGRSRNVRVDEYGAVTVASHPVTNAGTFAVQVTEAQSTTQTSLAWTVDSGGSQFSLGADTSKLLVITNDSTSVSVYVKIGGAAATTDFELKPGETLSGSAKVSVVGFITASGTATVRALAWR